VRTVREKLALSTWNGLKAKDSWTDTCAVPAYFVKAHDAVVPNL
jgi:hypothetical protein